MKDDVRILIVAALFSVAVPLWGVSPVESMAANGEHSIMGGGGLWQSSDSVGSVREGRNGSVEATVVYSYSAGVGMTVDDLRRSDLSIFWNDGFWVDPETADSVGWEVSANLDVEYDGPLLNLEGAYSVLETNQLSYDIQPRGGTSVDRDEVAFQFGAETLFGERATLEVDFSLEDWEYLDEGFYDRQMLTVPVDLYFGLTPDLELGGGYRYRQTELDRVWLSEDHFYHVGVRGKIGASLDGDLRVGLQNRTVNGLPTNETFLAAVSNFTWMASPRTTVGASLVRDLSTGRRGADINEQSAQIAVRYVISSLLMGNVNLRYTDADYRDGSGREDRYLHAGVSVTYTPRDFFRLTAGYIYQDNESNISGYSFENQIVNVSAALRY